MAGPVLLLLCCSRHSGTPAQMALMVPHRRKDSHTHKKGRKERDGGLAERQSVPRRGLRVSPAEVTTVHARICGLSICGRMPVSRLFQELHDSLQAVAVHPLRCTPFLATCRLVLPVIGASGAARACVCT